ncbi:hypothetical protein NSMM_400234 [Nitrosomonas mobilis]|uniref:Uncharacterized protein n=1 Tax=Nitrosomonas mobilis TaxID=51642 RepID=A0A1G5SEX1_9PROT|nr:hypothetical protein NSMM_400234 [Nitrosomonas mobilis]
MPILIHSMQSAEQAIMFVRGLTFKLRGTSRFGKKGALSYIILADFLAV